MAPWEPPADGSFVLFSKRATHDVAWYVQTLDAQKLKLNGPPVYPVASWKASSSKSSSRSDSIESFSLASSYPFASSVCIGSACGFACWTSVAGALGAVLLTCWRYGLKCAISSLGTRYAISCGVRLSLWIRDMTDLPLVIWVWYPVELLGAAPATASHLVMSLHASSQILLRRLFLKYLSDYLKLFLGIKM